MLNVDTFLILAARAHNEGATSWLSKSEFPGFSAYVSQILYSTVVKPVPRYRAHRMIDGNVVRQRFQRTQFQACPMQIAK